MGGYDQGLVLVSAFTHKPSPAPQLINTLAQAQGFCMRFDLPGWLLWRSGLKVLMVLDGADPRLAAGFNRYLEEIGG